MSSPNLIQTVNLFLKKKNIRHISASWLPSKLFVLQQFSEDCLDKLMLLPNWLFSSPGQFREVHREKEKLYQLYQGAMELRGNKRSDHIDVKEFLSFLFTFWKSFVFAQILLQNLAGIGAEITLNSCFQYFWRRIIYILDLLIFSRFQPRRKLD